MSRPGYEFLLHQFKRGGGLFFVGAGASTGITPFGNTFLAAPGLNYVTAGSFPVTVPKQSELNLRIIGAAKPLLANDFSIDGRAVRGDNFPFNEIVDRLPARFARMKLMHSLAKPAHDQQRSDNYSVFQHFAPSVIMNYNLDGLMRDARTAGHFVVDVHGTVPVGYGSPKAAALLRAIRDYDLSVPEDDLILSVREQPTHIALLKRLDQIPHFRPRFIALVGYSFARNGDEFDDWLSMRWLAQRFYGFRDDVYVIDPWPEQLQDAIAARLGSTNVRAVRGYWNLLSHAFILSLTSGASRNIEWICEDLLDRFGDRVAFPFEHSGDT